MFANIVFHDLYIRYHIFIDGHGTKYKDITDGDEVAAKGLVQLLSKEGLHFSMRASVGAAYCGHLNVIRWLHENQKGFSPITMNLAADGGHLNIIKWLLENRQEGCTSSAMGFAADRGYLEICKCLHKHRNKLYEYNPGWEICDDRAIVWAAASGHIKVVEWLWENFRHCNFNWQKSITDAIDNALDNGHHNVVRWLRENCGEFIIKRSGPFHQEPW